MGCGTIMLALIKGISWKSNSIMVFIILVLFQTMFDMHHVVPIFHAGNSSSNANRAMTFILNNSCISSFAA